MQILQCSLLLAGYPRGVASRPCPDGHGIQTLVATSMCELRILHGTDQRSGVRFGDALELSMPAEAGASALASASAPNRYLPTATFREPVWDPFSASIYLLDGAALLRLTPNNCVTLVAGHRSESGDEGGQGAAARFIFPRFPVSDGAGSLFLADNCRILQVKLPTVWRVGGQSPEPPSRTTFPFEAEVLTIATVPVEITGLAYVDSRDPRGVAAAGPSSVAPSGPAASSGGAGAGPSLVYATETALYRLPLGGGQEGDGGGGSGGGGGDGGAGAQEPVLLAGCEGVPGCCDGRGAAARFTRIAGIAADGGGSILIAEADEDDADEALLRRLGADGVVSSVSSSLEGSICWPTILPNGYLALCRLCPGSLLLLDLGLTPPRSSVVAAATAAAAGGAGAFPRGSGGGVAAAAAAAGAAGGGGRSLAADLGALLDRQPDGTSDLTITVGGQPFHVHRGILAARCDYFRQRLTGGFPDGAAPELDLPDADPSAFAALLRFLYTGAPAPPPPPDPAGGGLPPALLQPLAELADRLLLPELCAAAQAQLLASVTLDNVVELLIWAGDRGPAFEDARARLIAWYLEHQVEVMEHSPEAVKRMMVTCPDLAFDVHMAAAQLARR